MAVDKTSVGDVPSGDELCRLRYRTETAIRNDCHRRRVLGDTGRHTEAFSVLVEAAVGWWRSTGEFESGDIGLLNEQRPHLDQHTIDVVIDALEPATAAALRQQLDQS